MGPEISGFFRLLSLPVPTGLTKSGAKLARQAPSAAKEAYVNKYDISQNTKCSSFQKLAEVVARFG